MKLENITLTVPGNLIFTEERIIKHLFKVASV